jgi:hypothetical protein
MRFLVFDDVATHLLPESFWIAKSIKVIILQLECDTQVAPKLINQIGILLRCLGNDGAHFHRGSHQNRGLVLDHFEVFGNGDIVAIFKIHVPLLALTDFERGFAEQFCKISKHRWLVLLKVLVRQNQHGVA